MLLQRGRRIYWRRVAAAAAGIVAALAQGLHNMQVKVHSLVTSNNAEGTKDILEEGVLRELLAAVDLEYLLDRTGMHAAVNWHDTLSLGARPPSLTPGMRFMSMSLFRFVHTAGA
jgi:hypothetical protein